jgi:V8-like Glu-specific endopeptidase
MRGVREESEAVPQGDVVIAEVRRLFGDDLESLVDRLSVIDESDAPDFSGLGSARRQELVLDGVAGLRKINEARPSELTDAEIVGLEAIIALEGRPALFIQGGDFFGVPERWEILIAHRDAIKASIARVGRVEVTGHPKLDWVGTGFLAGSDTIVTNRHVAREFVRAGWSDGWRFRPGMSASVDFNREQGAAERLEFAVTGIVGIHDQYDLAVLKVAQADGSGHVLPTPLPVAAAQLGDVLDRMVYVVGYPAWDGCRNDALHMRKIFRDTYDVKRLQPGLVASWTEGAHLLTHDCSTLGGNSGSPVIDLETHQVIGLHFGGRYLTANTAIPLWELAGDELLHKAKMNFG